MTYREILETLKSATDAELDTEVCGFEAGAFVYWAAALVRDENGQLCLEGTTDVGEPQEPAPILKLHKGR